MTRARKNAVGSNLPTMIAAILLLAGAMPASVGAGGIPYQACGELVDSGGFPSCVVHVADDGQTVRPATLDGFRAGDRVVVSGLIDE